MLQGKCAKEATESTEREGSHDFAVPVHFKEDPIGVQENNLHNTVTAEVF